MQSSSSTTTRETKRFAAAIARGAGITTSQFVGVRRLNVLNPNWMEVRGMSDEKPASMQWHSTSKRGALLRIIRDLQRFNEDQLKILIDMAHKVRHAKR